MNTKRTAYVLTITSILIVTALFAMLFHDELQVYFSHRIGISSSITKTQNIKYTNNPNYERRMSLFKVYQPVNSKIVMLGDSITAEPEWNELLGRNDVVNRGIACDVTERFLGRLTDIYKLNPEMCFIMGGINDIAGGIPIKTIFNNYIKLIRELNKNNIIPVIQSTLYVSAEMYNWKITNTRVDELNALLRKYAHANNISYIDINRELSAGGALGMSYTYDGVHLRGSGYAKWKNLILTRLSP